MPSSIDISVIIVSWNVASLLENCLESVFSNLDGFSWEVFVVDNASKDHTIDMINKKFPYVTLIVNEKNIGFARANNQALKRAKGRFVLILNPDAILTPGSLKKLIAFMEDHPEIGLVGPCIRYPHGEVQNTCARLLPTLSSTLLFYFLKIAKLPRFGKWYADKYLFPYDYNVTQEVEAVSGAAMMLRQEILTSINGFGEPFLHCGEDIDLCFRVRRAGWKIYYCCEAVVVHLSGQSSRQVPVRSSVNTMLSLQEYLNRCFGINQAIIYRLIVQVVQPPLMIVIGCIKFFLRSETGQEFRSRLEIAKSIWRWRAVE
jgi:GT2 family glycosyltransferase